MEDSWYSQLIGRAVVAVEQWEGCPCIVKFGGGYRLQVESPWRLLSSGNLTLASKSTHAVPELSCKLLGQTLDALQVTRGTVDLTLDFGEHTLQVVSDSSVYEAWQVEGPAGTVAVGQGGGSVVVWD